MLANWIKKPLRLEKFSQPRKLPKASLPFAVDKWERSVYRASARMSKNVIQLPDGGTKSLISDWRELALREVCPIDLCFTEWALIKRDNLDLMNDSDMGQFAFENKKERKQYAQVQFIYDRWLRRGAFSKNQEGQMQPPRIPLMTRGWAQAPWVRTDKAKFQPLQFH